MNAYESIISHLGERAQEAAGISRADLSVGGLLGLCVPIERAELRRGDWLFRAYKSGSRQGQVYHVGFVVDDDLNVIEAKGRDGEIATVRFEEYAADYWSVYGRLKQEAEPPALPDPEPAPQETEEPNAPEPEEQQSPPDPDGDEQPPVEGWRVARVLQVTKPQMEGEDVQSLQNELIARGFHCGVAGANGVYGKETAVAVRHFQSMNRLIVDGKAGKFTVKALGGVWEQ